MHKIHKLVYILIFSLVLPVYGASAYPRVNELCNDIAQNGWKSFKVKIENSRLDVNNDKIDESISMGLSGTARVPNPYYLNTDGERISIKKEGYEWKTYSTYGIRYVRQEGVVFRLHCMDNSCSNPRYLEYISPRNIAYVACEFKQEVSVVSLSDLPVCLSRARYSPNSYLPLEEHPGFNSKKWKRHFTSYENFGKIDFNNDGVEDNIVLAGYYSGSGRGCSFRYFDLLDKNWDIAIGTSNRDALLKMQKVKPGREGTKNSSDVPHWSINRTGWFVFKNTVFYESRSTDKNGLSPSSYHNIFSIDKDGIIKKYCDYKFEVHTNLEKVNELPN